MFMIHLPTVIVWNSRLIIIEIFLLEGRDTSQWWGPALYLLVGAQVVLAARCDLPPPPSSQLVAVKTGPALGAELEVTSLTLVLC